MSQARGRPDAFRNSDTERKGTERSSGRRLAEWVSLGVSVLLIAAMAGYLIYQGLQRELPYLAATAQPLMSEVRREGDRYILPVAVANRSAKTMRELKVEVRYRSAEGEWETREIQIDYLGERARQKTYLYFDQDPRTFQVEAEPLLYRLE